MISPTITQFTMIEIVIITTIAMLCMARKGRRRRMGRYIRGDVNEGMPLTTLAARTVVSADFDSVVNERTLVSSVIAIYTLAKFTKATDDGPIMVGLAHGDYSSAEIQAVLDATGSWNEGDLIAREVGNRKVRRIGVFDVPLDADEVSVLNDGKRIKTKLNWILLQGQTLKLWAFNMGTSAIATTAPVVHCEGHANLWPR